MNRFSTARAHLLPLTLALLLPACGGGQESGADVDGMAAAPALDPARPLPDTAPVPGPPPASGDAAAGGGLRPDEAPPTAGSAPDADSTGTAPAPVDTVAGWTAGIEEGGAARSSTATLVDVRVGRHEDFDRIVLEFAAAPVPRYHLEYVDRPVRQCGSGNVVELPGDGWLAIRLRGTRGHDDAGGATVDHAARSPGLPNLQRLVFTCDFEAEVELVAAVGSPEAYQVRELAAPPRLVVDIRH